MARTTRDIEDMGKTVETMARTARESTRIMTHYVVRAQELNTRFARRAFEAWIDASRRQTELSPDHSAAALRERRGPGR